MKKTMKWLVMPIMLLTLGATSSHRNQSTDEMKREKEFVISTCVHQMGKDIWVFETKMNKNTGKIISRKQVHSKKYKNVK